MRKLTNIDILKNNVDTVSQYKVLNYLKKHLNILEFLIFLYDKDTIKVIDKNNCVGYFKYDKDINDVIFTEELLEENINFEI